MSNNTSTAYPFISEEAKEEYLSFCHEKSRLWPSLANNEERMIDTLYGQTFLRIEGPLDSPPLLLVPGDEETSLAFAYIVESLAREFRVYALDRVGDNGRSIPNSERPIRSKDDMVQWLDEVVTELVTKSDGRRIIIVAHSYGAWQVSLYAATHPKQIERMVLMAPPATVFPIRLGMYIRAIIYGVIPLKSVTTMWYNNWFDPISMNEKQSREYILGVLEDNALSKRLKYSKAFIHPTSLADKDWQTINSIIPTLFLVGDSEVMYSPEQAIGKLNRVAPLVQCKIVPKADHHLMIIRSDWVSKVMLDFLVEKKGNEKVG